VAKKGAKKKPKKGVEKMPKKGVEKLPQKMPFFWPNFTPQICLFYGTFWPSGENFGHFWPAF
jgi:hypothetical protein